MGKTSTVVVDAGPVIHLDELGCLDLLADFGDVIVPEVVWLEVECHRPLALDVAGIRFIRQVPRQSSSLVKALTPLYTFHA